MGMASYFSRKRVAKASEVGRTRGLINYETPENIPKDKLKDKKKKKFHLNKKKRKE